MTRLDSPSTPDNKRHPEGQSAGIAGKLIKLTGGFRALLSKASTVEEEERTQAITLVDHFRNHSRGPGKGFGTHFISPYKGTIEVDGRAVETIPASRLEALADNIVTFQDGIKKRLGDITVYEARITTKGLGAER